jgi:hypothetical protein
MKKLSIIVATLILLLFTVFSIQCTKEPEENNDPDPIDIHDFQKWDITISLNLDWINYEGSDDNLTPYYSSITGNLHFNNSGTYNGRSYSSKWNDIHAINIGSKSDTARDQGELIVNFDEKYEKITNLSFKRSVKYIYKYGGDLKPDPMYFHWDLNDVPLVSATTFHIIFSVSDTETCNHLKNVERSNWWDNGMWEKMDSYNCNGTTSGLSAVNITFDPEQ